MGSLAKLIEQYHRYEQQYDIEAMAGCFRQLEKLNREVPAEELQFFQHRSGVLSFGILQALQRHDGKCALEYMSCFQENAVENPVFWLLKAMCFYELSEWEQAEKIYSSARQRFPQDELIPFYLGNIHYQRREWPLALACYEQALRLKRGFFEAAVNMVLTLRRMGKRRASAAWITHPEIQKGVSGGRLQLYPWISSLYMQDADYRKIPIFINSRDRLGCLQQLISWLLRAGYENICILDMASTYGPLLEYYDAVSQQGVQVVRVSQNLGHTALWSSGILERLQVLTPYVYTDSDVVPGQQCPPDFLRHYMEILRQNPLLKKVGSGLVLDDITCFDAVETQRSEGEFYYAKVGPDMCCAPVDTTLALYRNYRHYHVGVDIRMTGPYMARHLPWYYDYEQLPEDELYYMQHANHSSTMSQKAKAAMEEK